jgi:small subunit ribosomal protein S7
MDGKPLLFNRWDTSGVKTEDQGLVKYVNLKPLIVPRTGAKYGGESVHKFKISIVERFMNRLMVPGHRGKRHKITSGCCSGSTQAIYLAVKEAFDIVEKKRKENPVQVLVRAVENSAPLEEVASYRLGGMIARKAVVISPQRRLDLALRHFTQGIYKITFKNRRPFAKVLADQIMAAADNDAKCFSISERIRIEKEAEGAR